MKYILSIDIGTSNTKAIGYASDGSLVAHANSGYNFDSKREGYHELDPQLLFDAVTKVIHDAVAEGRQHQLVAISFSSAMHGIFAVDDSGNPLTNMITWADLRSSDYAKKLKGTPQGTRIYERTGTPIHPMSPLCKLMWMKDNLPDIFEKAAKFISIKEFIFHRLFGEYLIDESIASATGLFDIYDRSWNAEALTLAGITPEQLSKPVDVYHIGRGLAGAYPSQLGIDPQLPFVIGGSDGCLAHIGSNAFGFGDVSITIGTSGAVRMMCAAPVKDPGQRIFNYLLDGKTYVTGGPTNNGGNILEWYCRNMAGRPEASTADYDWFVQEAMKSEPGSAGLIFLPYIYGERAPVWDADARGMFFGINGTHTQSHFMRAILEGLCFSLAQLLNTMEEAVAHVEHVFASGGFVHSAAWVQTLADVIGKPLQVLDTEDSSAFGAAIVGMKAIGMIGELRDARSFFKVKESFAADQENAAVYRKNAAIFGQLYEQFKSIKK